MLVRFRGPCKVVFKIIFAYRKAGRAVDQTFSGKKNLCLKSVFEDMPQFWTRTFECVHASSVGDKKRYLLYVDGKRIQKRALHLSFTVPAKTFFNAVVLRVERTRVFIILTVIYYHTLWLHTVFVFDYNYNRYASRISVDRVLRHFETNK